MGNRPLLSKYLDPLLGTCSCFSSERPTMCLIGFTRPWQDSSNALKVGLISSSVIVGSVSHPVWSLSSLDVLIALIVCPFSTESGLFSWSVSGFSECWGSVVLNCPLSFPTSSSDWVAGVRFLSSSDTSASSGCDKSLAFAPDTTFVPSATWFSISSFSKFTNSVFSSIRLCSSASSLSGSIRPSGSNPGSCPVPSSGLPRAKKGAHPRDPAPSSHPPPLLARRSLRLRHPALLPDPHSRPVACCRGGSLPAGRLLSCPS